MYLFPYSALKHLRYIELREGSRIAQKRLYRILQPNEKSYKEVIQDNLRVEAVSSASALL